MSKRLQTTSGVLTLMVVAGWFVQAPTGFTDRGPGTFSGEIQAQPVRDINTDVPVWQPGLDRTIHCSGHELLAHREACQKYEIEPVYR